MKLPKTAGGVVNLLFRIFGILALTGPAIRGVTEAGSNFAAIPRNIVYRYTGVDIQGQVAFSTPDLTTGITAIASGAVLIYIGKWLGKAIR